MRHAPLAYRRAPYYEPDTDAPDPVPCELCDGDIDWVWVEMFSRWGWCRGNNPHPACKAAHDREQLRELTMKAARRANVPLRSRGHTFDYMDIQTDQPDWLYMHEAQRHPTRISCLRVNGDATRTIAHYKPGAKRWLYIQGGLGRGKTLLASALVVDQVKPSAGTFIEPDPEWLAARGLPADARPPGSRRLVAPRRWRTMFCDWPEVLRRIQLAWKRDQAPLQQVADVPLLVLDDLGNPDQPLRPGHRDEIEKLLCARYRDERPTVITSNVPWWEAIDADNPYFGSRVADRLAEVCDHVTLRGPSWRNPPPRPNPGPVVFPIIDKKAAAAGDDLFTGDKS